MSHILAATWLVCKLAWVYMSLIQQAINSIFISAVPGAFELTSLHPFLGAASSCLPLSLRGCFSCYHLSAAWRLARLVGRSLVLVMVY